MVVVAIDEAEVEESLVTIPADFELQSGRGARGPGGGGQRKGPGGGGGSGSGGGRPMGRGR